VVTGADVAATMAATFVDEWVRAGLTDVVIAPGSRSTPITLAVLADGRLRTHVHVDERSAAFMALGLGRGSGRPAPVVTTSGTAAVELHPAVVEAHHAAVPMILCTADRPPELQGIASPQTIDQRRLYGGSVRSAAQIEPATGDDRPRWRSWAARSVLAATGDPPGPVHCNMAFREPLLGTAQDLPVGRPGGAPWHRRAGEPPTRDLGDLEQFVADAPAGVIVAGRGCEGAAAVAELGLRLGWPVLADPLSGLRSRRHQSVAAFDPLLRSPTFATDEAVPAAVQFGAAPASKVLGRWLDDHGTARAVVGVGPELPAVGRDAEVVVRAQPGAVAEDLGLDARRPSSPDARARWAAADGAAQRVLDRELAGSLSEPAVARTVAAAMAEGGALVVSSSMPVRDLEWYGPHRDGITVLANRGANGIDGVVSTAVGVALTGRPTVALLGDLAFLHDSNGLLGVADRPVDLTLVVVDNDGGGIFSFLPQAEQVPAPTFETAFGTPHGLDLVAVAAALGAPARRIDSSAELVAAVERPDGASVVVVGSDRATNVVVHEQLEAAVAAALTP
jgi:2-succinyl-5-enolpyruvyl-6-hydroxy-3-cyclohexene-1-carboxylate synthase